MQTKKMIQEVQAGAGPSIRQRQSQVALEVPLIDQLRGGFSKLKAQRHAMARGHA